MLEIVVPILLGIVVGLFTGIMPGIGIVTILSLLYPILYKFNISELFLFYFSILNSSQYYGSIIASAFGLTAEITSLPAVKHGHKMFKEGNGKEAITSASTGSFIASVIAIAFLIVIHSFFFEYLHYLLKGIVIFTVLTVVLLISILNTDNKLLSSVFAIVGLFLGYVGLRDLFTYTAFATFDSYQLEGGIPLYPLMCGLIIIPLILKYKKIKSSDITVEATSFKSRFEFLIKLKYISSIMRGSIIGFISGIVPGSSYLISSNVAESIEHKFSKIHENIKFLVSAESANNAGTVSVLIPLLIIGIPIVASESMILGIAETKGYNISMALHYFNKNFDLIVLSLFAVNFLNWIISGIYYNIIIKVYNLLKDYAYQAIGFISIASMIFFAINEYRLELSIITFLISLLIGLIIKDERPKFLLLICYFISGIYLDEFYRIFLI